MIEDAEESGKLKPGATIIVSGIVIITLYPFAAATAAIPIPVLPDVGSIILGQFVNEAILRHTEKQQDRKFGKIQMDRLIFS